MSDSARPGRGLDDALFKEGLPELPDGAIDWLGVMREIVRFDRNFDAAFTSLPEDARHAVACRFQ